MHIIEATAFSVAPHADGLILSVLAGPTIAANVRLTPELVRQLGRSLHNGLLMQQAVQAREQASRAR